MASAPSGRGGAGEDAHRLTGPEHALVGAAGGRPSDHLEPSRDPVGDLGHVGRAHRVAVHGGNVRGRLGDPRRHVLGQHAAQRLGQAHGLGRQRREGGRDARQRFGDGEHVSVFRAMDGSHLDRRILTTKTPRHKGFQ